MRVSQHTYEAYKGRAQQIFDSLEKNGLLLKESKDSIIKYFEAADITKGAPHKGEWRPVNDRAGYQFDIPGLISEVISQTCASTLPNFNRVRIVQDKVSQVELKIDFVAVYNSISGNINDLDTQNKEITHQSKTIRFSGTRAPIEKYYTEGVPQIIDLVDIDDQQCYFIGREDLERLRVTGRGYCHKWDLDANCTNKFDLRAWYS